MNCCVLRELESRRVASSGVSSSMDSLSICSIIVFLGKVMNKRVLLSPVVAGSGISHNLVAFGVN